jgi:hypothetical protein
MTQSTTSDDFHALWQRLWTLWRDSEQLWDDPVRRDFEKTYMTPLQDQTTATLKEMAKLLEVIAKAQREVK